MGVYINMEMPEHCGYCRFRYDGICHALQKTQYSMEECPLVPVPPHRDLIDADEFYEALTMDDRVSIIEAIHVKSILSEVPIIIPAEQPKEET